MLQDLEARQSQTDDITADYRAPPKKRTKLWVLLILIIAAIIFVLTYKSQLFGENKSTEVTTVVNKQPLPTVVAKKMTVAPQKARLQPSVQPSKTKSKLVVTAADITLADEQISPNENKTAKENVTSLQTIDTQDEQKQQKQTQNSPELNNSLELNKSPHNPQATPEQTSSFSMSGSENNTRSLKQRIAQSLNNENHDLAQSLLSELLAIEPDNIKARKKSASLLFAQGNYAQSRQLLIQGIELHPTQSDLRLMLARLYVVQKEPSQAMKTLAEFQPRKNNQIEYLAYRAALAQQLKQTTLAQSDYTTLTNIEPANAKWWLGLAIARDQLGEINMALQAYNKANSLEQFRDTLNDFIQQRILVLAGAQ
jgi:MSHA biogenesis protein MshN